MNYINITKKKLVGRSNQAIAPLVMDYSTIQTLDFQLIDSKNQIVEFQPASGLYFAGALKIGPDEKLLFLSQNIEVVSGVIQAQVDTYTETWLKNIKKKYTEINIELGIAGENVKQVILRDTALACPRVYVEGSVPAPPPPTPGGDFYTKQQVDYIVSGLQAQIQDVSSPEWTALPAGSTEVALTDGLYTHAPSAAPIYTLPAVADGLLHDITIEVLFSAGALSVAFFDAGGNLIPPRDMAGTIAAGKSVVYLCRFAPLKNAWVIMPVMED